MRNARLLKTTSILVFVGMALVCFSAHADNIFDREMELACKLTQTQREMVILNIMKLNDKRKPIILALVLWVSQ